jgi:sporulation protein YlmC with PRC-barrel domain
MRANECRLESLLGRRVLDAEGKLVGRIEEVVAEYRDGDYLVREFHVGRFAVFERLGGGMLGSGLLRLIGGNRVYDGYVIPWKLMDLSDVDHPRATIARDELPRMNDTAHPSSSARPAEKSTPRRTA